MLCMPCKKNPIIRWVDQRSRVSLPVQINMKQLILLQCPLLHYNALKILRFIHSPCIHCEMEVTFLGHSIITYLYEGNVLPLNATMHICLMYYVSQQRFRLGKCQEKSIFHLPVVLSV